ncbi:iron chelate uptake ABC transporter family permease subunit [Nocardiopsis sp. N85]|uniref:FecCD family ABC transporter permease n=1 Tax=Nocardiopsis sp. N85 TaxID=3029400 RepID=UPI00237F070A|nr:iron chelate uptake ABC transporter family permease subunit [Nocardiopsis sp. N85]MDE3721823.1 iron chelate uptake ABC transporter family permease subunit [Nocardiopsis sp. N85]
MSDTIVLRVAGASPRSSLRASAVHGLLLLLLLGCLLAALSMGSRPLTPVEVIAALAPDAHGPNRLVVVEWRAPRAVAAVLFGACLGLSGALFQSLTRNPLGSPDVIGLNTGAHTGVVCVLLLGGGGHAASAGGAVLGGLGAALLVYLLALRQGMRGFRLIIVGIAISAMLTSVNTWFSVKADLDMALRVAVWGAGTLNGAAWPPVAVSVVGAALLVLVMPVLGPRMRQLELGDDTASMSGVPVERTKVLMVVVGVGFTSVVTAVTGPISFVALAAPQIARRLTGRGGTVDPLGAALVGAVLLSTADLVAQHALPNTVLPVGAVTVCLGGAYLVWLLVRESGRS